MNYSWMGTERPSSLLIGLFCILMLTGCDISPPAEAAPPEPGQLSLWFETSNDAEGAVRIRIKGPGAGAVTAVQDGSFVFSRVDGSSSEVVVIGMLRTGTLLRFEVTDVNRFEEYTASIAEVADLENRLRTEQSEYILEIRR